MWYQRYFVKNAFYLIAFLLSIIFPVFSQDNGDAAQVELSSKALVQSYFTKGEELKKNGAFDEAMDYFNRAVNNAERNRDIKGKLDSLINLGILYWNIGELRVSSEKFAQALTIAQNLKIEEKIEFCETALTIYENYNEAKNNRTSGNISGSIDRFQKAIELARRIKSKEHELKCLRQLSLTYWEENNLQDFLFLNREALVIARELNHQQEEGRCLNNIGLFYWRIDSYSEALKNLESSLIIARKLGDKKEEANCLTNIATIYIQLGNYDNALEYLLLAVEISKNINEEPSISHDLNNIGSLFRRKGIISDNKDDFKKALKFFNESWQIANKYEDISTQIKVLNNMGAVHSNLNDYSTSLNYFHDALKKANEIHNKEEISFILTNMGIVHAHLGNYEESTKYYQMAIDLALEIRGGKILWEAYLELANAYKHQDNLLAALDNYKKSISVIENIRSGIDMEELKATFLGSEKRIESYYNIIDLLVKLNQKEDQSRYKAEAFHYLERAKARAFLDSLEVSKITLSEGISQKLLNQETELMNEISKIHTKLLTPQLSPEQRIEANKELEKYEEQLESLKREIRSSSPAYANLRYPRPIKLDEAQRNLFDKETAVFAYIISKESSYAFVITQKDISIFPLPNYLEIQKLVRSYLSAITDIEGRDFHLGYRLYNILVKPGLGNVKARKIVFIPDDILYFLPFETLLTRSDDTAWLIKEYDVTYVPSLSALRELIERRKTNNRKPTKDILALGDPYYGKNETELSKIGESTSESNFYPDSDYQFFRLRYSGQEVKKIASFFKPQKRDILLREDASEENLKEQKLSDYRIIHLATHGIINDKKPSRSAIVLTLDDDPKEDGFLQMREIFNLKLNADLVALSACQTGLGQLIRGEGIEGLSRAFFYAGASSVLLSLWAINDQASSQLLERFYFHLRSSQPLSSALRKAKLDMIDSGVLSHPYFWAGFIASGETDRIILRQNINKWILLTVSLCAGLAILVFWINRDKTNHSTLSR